MSPEPHSPSGGGVSYAGVSLFFFVFWLRGVVLSLPGTPSRRRGSVQDLHPSPNPLAALSAPCGLRLLRGSLTEAAVDLASTLPQGRINSVSDSSVVFFRCVKMLSLKRKTYLICSHSNFLSLHFLRTDEKYKPRLSEEAAHFWPRESPPRSVLKLSNLNTSFTPQVSMYSKCIQSINSNTFRARWVIDSLLPTALLVGDAVCPFQPPVPHWA